MLLYNIGVRLAALFFRIGGTVKPLQRYLSAHHPKASRFIEGQKGLMPRVKGEMGDDTGEVYWFHAASFGEYNVIRPVVKGCRKSGRRIVVTFFSSSGYDAFKAENQKTGEADHVFYLPWDTPSNVRQFLDAIHPDKAIFAISEYWLNYLHELGKRKVPTYLVSMQVGSGSYLLKWYGAPIRKALKSIHTFMVLDEASKRHLADIGFHNVVVTGDPLFDNAMAIAKEPYHNDIIERFCQHGEEVLVAGSMSDGKDLELVASLTHAHRDVRFIVVPHEISADGISRISQHIEAKTLLYSKCNESTRFDDAQVLVVDFLGALARIYRYGQWAYVGGGFTPYLHSVVEPVVYGIPVAFGPRIERKKTAKQMTDLGIGEVVRTEKDINSWFDNVRDHGKMADIKEKARQYTEQSSDVASKVIKVLSA